MLGAEKMTNTFLIQTPFFPIKFKVHNVLLISSKQKSERKKKSSISFFSLFKLIHSLTLPLVVQVKNDTLSNCN